MILDQEKITRIKRFLKSRPKGLTISDISSALKINRNSVAKYLEILLITGQVEVKIFGNAKVYYLSSRVPISSMLRFASELILVLDFEGRITEVNDNFLDFFGRKRDDLVGNGIQSLDFPPFRELSPQTLLQKAAVQGEVSSEARFTHHEGEKYLRFKIIPTVFEDGGDGTTIIMEDITLPKQFEEQLRINEARYRGIVEDQTEMITRFGPDFLIRFVNTEACQSLGKTREELIGKDFWNYIPAEDRIWIKERILSLSKDHPVDTIEHRFISPSGEILWHQWTNRAILNDRGEVVEYQGVGRDITARKKAEEELLIKNLAIDSSVNGIGIAGLDRKITYANQAFTELFGYRDLAEVLGMPLDQCAHGSVDAMRDIMQVMAAISEKGSWVGEVKAQKKDGTSFFAQLSATLVRDEAGTPLCMMASFVDITAKKEAEREMMIKDTAIESSITGIAIVSADRKIIYANQSFLSIFGFSSHDEVQGTSWDGFVAGYDVQQPVLDQLKETLQKEGRWIGEFRTRKVDGDLLYLLVSVSLVQDAGEALLCWMVSFLDITGQKMIEQTLKSTVEKLQDTIEFMPDPTFVVDRNKRVIAWNSALEALTNTKKEEVLGRSDYQHAFSLFREIRPVLIDILDLPAHKLANSYPSVRRFGDSIYVEAFIPGANEGQGACLWGKASPLIDREGNIIGAIESLRDITEWKRAHQSILSVGANEGNVPEDRVKELESSLVSSKEEIEELIAKLNAARPLEEAFSDVVDPLVLIDRSGRIIRCSRSFCRMVGVDAEPDGNNIAMFCAPEERKPMLEWIKKAGPDRSIQFSASLLRVGSRLPVEGIAIPVGGKRERSFMLVLREAVS
ncbi:PAS domain S-box-containing protein [Methanolinea mesophila]|uniref:PAS domain S-box protein n=1 Tax=Methanolinea mesophila TaxID=547055 RepID=UPI001AE2B3EA|nr:PAS domain S-box protein [Methanolinea mesophila]MBP1928788.1 PAS domain S-box-containing protein [Methanolinea mesophila]